MKTVLALLPALLVLGACSGHRGEVTMRKDAPKVQKIVVMPFTDDPLAPGSGLRAASYFQKAAQARMPTVQWVGPAEVLKGQGVEVGQALEEDTVLDAPGAIEPVLGQILKASATVAALNPNNESMIAQQQQADAVVRGAVYYDPGTGMVESMITKKRSTEAGLAIQVADAKTGQVFLAFRQEPQENKDRPTMNQMLRDTAESAADRIGGTWK
jgi:hypothetical protein